MITRVFGSSRSSLSAISIKRCNMSYPLINTLNKTHKDSVISGSRLFFTRSSSASDDDKPQPIGKDDNSANQQQQQQETITAPVEDQKQSDDGVKVKELEQQVKELKDHYLRALADAENLRERTRREREQTQQLAIKKFASDLLSVSDILDIAVSSVPEQARNDESNPHLKNLYTGLTMTVQELHACFKRHHIVSFDPIGQKFDPNMHQALYQVPATDNNNSVPGTVHSVAKKGYTLNGVVLRAAQVGVVADSK